MIKKIILSSTNLVSKSLYYIPYVLSYTVFLLLLCTLQNIDVWKFCNVQLGETFFIYWFTDLKNQVGRSEKIFKKILFFKNQDCHNDNMSQLYLVRVNYRERGFLARYNPRGVSRRKHPEGRRPEGCFLRATLPRDVSR